MAGDAVLEFSDDNFQQEVLESDVPVLVDFFTTWCGPCRMLAPTIDDVASEYQGRVKVGKIDAEANASISMQYQIQSVPTLIFFKGGQMVQRGGFMSKTQLKAVLDQLVG